MLACMIGLQLPLAPRTSWAPDAKHATQKLWLQIAHTSSTCTANVMLLRRWAHTLILRFLRVSKRAHTPCTAQSLSVQEWSWLQALVAQQVWDHNLLAMAYVAGRAAAVPAWLRAAAAAARLNLHNVHGQGHWPAPGLRETMACSCAHGTCFKVLKGDSVQRGLRRGNTDPLACPACSVHKDVCHTYSPLVEKFHEIVQGMWPGVAVVWDWVDIPGLPSYHFDATLVWPANVWPPARFEVDGKRHFKQAYSMRRVQDVQKDVVVSQLGVSMLRLHELDLAEWQAKIAVFVANLNGTVRWTPAFHACLTAEQRLNII